ncbi:hypothetical protein J4558_16770 [Leptolyngbya sp. 15MV]|nr:hypothetical protein J4558_16770 [Leptolyngbya sp. 15MV]
MTAVLRVFERHACRVVSQHCSTQRRSTQPSPCRDRLVVRMRELAIGNPRRGRRYVIDLLHKEGWSIGTLAEARYLADRWRLHNNHRCPQRALGTQTPAAYPAICPAMPPLRHCRTRRELTSCTHFHHRWSDESDPVTVGLGCSPPAAVRCSPKASHLQCVSDFVSFGRARPAG